MMLQSSWNNKVMDTYWGKNIDSERAMNVNRDNFANWEILIVEESPNFKYRNVVINGFHLRMQNRTNTLNTSLSSIPMADKDVTGQAILSSSGGNTGFFSGKAYVNSIESGKQIGQVELLSGTRGNDLLQGRITNNGVDVLDRNPGVTPGNIDLITQDLGAGIIKDGSDNVGFSLTTATDIVFLHMFGIAVDVGVPDIDIETYIEEKGNTDSYFKLNDTVEIKNTITTNPLKDEFFLDSPIVTVELPYGTEYIPNSVISEDNKISSEVYDQTTNTLKLYFENEITNNSFDFLYKIQSKEGIKVSNIKTTLFGYNKGRDIITDLELSYNSNDISLYPAYSVTINHINELTNENLIEEVLNGIYNEEFSGNIANIEGLSFNNDTY